MRPGPSGCTAFTGVFPASFGTLVREQAVCSVQDGEWRKRASGRSGCPGQRKWSGAQGMTVTSSNVETREAMEEERAEAKDRLLAMIKVARSELRVRGLAPATDVGLREDLNNTILQATKQLEQLAPTPRPVYDTPGLLDGAWLTIYSNAREITSLAKLPFGFRCLDIYQIINVRNCSFVNLAMVGHQTGLVRGFVRVTAIFTANPGPSLKPGVFLPAGNLLRVQFKQRATHITTLLGFLPAPASINPLQVADAGGGTPKLKVTYLDEDLRIGRSANGIYILVKSEKLPRMVPPTFLP